MSDPVEFETPAECKALIEDIKALWKAPVPDALERELLERNLRRRIERTAARPRHLLLTASLLSAALLLVVMLFSGLLLKNRHPLDSKSPTAATVYSEPEPAAGWFEAWLSPGDDTVFLKALGPDYQAIGAWLSRPESQ